MVTKMLASKKINKIAVSKKQVTAKVTLTAAEGIGQVLGWVNLF
jgi:hypothetical protein